MTDDAVTVGQLLLVEYEQLKTEQRSRIRVRDNLPYVALTATAAVIAGTLNTPGRVGLLLLLPPVGVIVGWIYLVNDQKISAVGEYIRDEIVPQLSAITGGSRVFGWESAHRADARRRSRKWLQLAVDLTTFGVLPLIAVMVFWVHGRLAPLVTVVSVVEVVAVLLLATQIVLYADLSSAEETGEREG